MSDYDAIYIDAANSDEPNSVHHNYVDGIGNPDQQNIGIYLNAHTTNTQIFHNVVLNIGPKRTMWGNY